MAAFGAKVQQGNVTSLPSATGRGYITVVVPPDMGGCSQLHNVHSVIEADVGTDPDFDYPYGLTGFALDCESVKVTLILHAPLGEPLRVYRKFGPTPPLFNNPHFYTLPGAMYGTAKVPPPTGPTVTTVMILLTNGQLGDDTPASDGMIVDPSGPAVAASATAPVTSERGLLVLVGLLCAVAAFGLWRHGTARVQVRSTRTSTTAQP